MMRHLLLATCLVGLAGCGLGTTNTSQMSERATRATSSATYTCDAWGYLTVAVLADSGEEFELKTDVGDKSECQWFVDNFAERKTYVRSPTIVAACDTWGYMTKIRVIPDGAPTLLGRPDVGDKDECLQKASLLNSTSAGDRPTAVATYTCDAWGYMTVNVMADSGEEFELKTDVGDESECQWFVDNYAERKTYVRSPTVVAACDTWGYMTKIRVIPDGAPTLLGRPDVGDKDECLQQASLLNSTDAGGRPTAVAAYSCDAWGYMHVTLETPNGQSFEVKPDVGSEEDCRWFTSTWAERKSRIRDTTIVAACDTWGYISKIRLDRDDGITVLPKTDVGSQEECLVRATQINNAP